MTRKVTITILIAMTLALIGYDSWVQLAHPSQGATVSEIVFYFAQRHPVLPFLIGVVAGHLLWGSRPEKADGTPA